MSHKIRITHEMIEEEWERRQNRAPLIVRCIILPLCFELLLTEGIFKGRFPNAALRAKIIVFTVMSANVIAIAAYFWRNRTKTPKDGEQYVR